jgi:hypothetical protein
MKTIRNQAVSIVGRERLTSESKLCFGAAVGCFVLGSVGYAINALTATHTTLSAFLVVSAFYLVLGVVSLFKKEARVATYEEASDEPLESAA